MSSEAMIPVDSATQREETNLAEADHGKSLMAAGVESALRASIGLFALGKEEAEAIVNRMVERGELAEKDGGRILRDLYERPRQGVQQLNQHVESALDEARLRVLDMLNVPTQSDLQMLSEKINELAEKVQALSEKIAS